MNMFTLLQTTAAGQGGSGLSMWIMLALIFIVMWFFMIRPQRKQQKELDNFRNSLKNGDKVVTIGGIYKDVKVRVSKQALVKDFTDPARQ